MVGARGGSLSLAAAADAGGAGLLAIAGSDGNGDRDQLSSWLLRRDAGRKTAGGRT